MKAFINFFLKSWALPFALGFIVTVVLLKIFHSKPVQEEEFLEKEGVFWVTEVDSNGDIKNQILADRIRFNKENGEVICKDLYSDDYYIFSNKCSVRDLSKTVDYIKFTTDNWSLK